MVVLIYAERIILTQKENLTLIVDGVCQVTQ